MLKSLRDTIAMLKGAGRGVYVLINGGDGSLTREDLATAVCAELDGILFPDVRAARDIRRLDVLIREQETRNGVRPGTPVLLPVIASAAGVLRCEEIALASTRIAGLVFDAEAYSSDLALQPTAEGRELDYARGVVVNVAAAHRLQALDWPIEMGAGTIAAAEHARGRGFRGLVTQRADEIEACNRVFASE
jgi:citrate lyase subunit beta/citryl-CoA lyase